MSVTMGNGVTSIGGYAFKNCSRLTSVTIPDSVTSIGQYAFYRCSSLTGITVNENNKNYKSIDGNLYSKDGKTLIQYAVGKTANSFTIPDSVTSIGSYAFERCSSLASVMIGNSVTSIGGSAFSGCSSLASVTIPNSITSIGDRAFEGCSSLTINCEAAEKLSGWDSSWNTSNCPIVWNCKNNDKDANGYIYTVIEGIRYSLKDGIATVVSQPKNITTANILSKITYNNTEYSVTSIGGEAFEGCSSLTSVTIPNSVTSIGNYAFKNCSSLTIYCEAASEPSGWSGYWSYDCGESIVWNCKNNDVTNYGCAYTVIDGVRYRLNDGIATVVSQPKNITTANIPAKVTYKNTEYSVTSIGYEAFRGCNSLTSVTIGNGVTSIDRSAFNGCNSLTSITIGYGVTSIGVFAFEGCSRLASVTIPSSVTSIGSGAFQDCSSLTSVTIRNSVTSIGDRAFSGCYLLTSITIPDSVTSIAWSAFSGCYSLTSVTIGNSVTSIGDYAFGGCYSLTSITIPNSVTSIGDRAFGGCPIETATIPTLAISSIPKENLKTVVITSGESIGAGAFSSCSSLTSVTIGNSVSGIDNSAFSGCPIETATIPTFAISSIPKAKLKTVIITSGQSIGDYTFSGCSLLTSIKIPNSVTIIGDYAFERCSSLASITIPNSVTSIGSSAFYGCPIETATIPALAISRIPKAKLKTVVITSGQSIGDYTFSGCSLLTSIKIPNSVTSIGESAFYNCSSLTEIKFKDMASYCQISGLNYVDKSKVYIGEQKLKEMTRIAIPDGVTSIGSYAFYGCSALISITIPDSVTSIGDYAFRDCSSLTDITFNGTMEQWNAIDKLYAWNDGTGEYTIHCTDGDISKS